MDLLSIVILFFLVAGLIVFVGFLILMAFTTGFKNTGRKMGGLNLLFGPPSNGKSYIATEAGLDFMKRGRKCFSNYMIRSVDGRYCSRVWKKGMMKENLTGSVIIWDELQVDFFSRMFKDTTIDEVAWFTKLAQYEITIYMVTQHFDNLDIILRRVVNNWIFVEKVTIPFFDIPLFFRVYTFSSLDQYNEWMHGRAEPDNYERFFFSKDIASAYDTKWFAKDDRKEFEGTLWTDYYKAKGLELGLPEDVSLITRYNRFVYKTLSNLVDTMYTYKNKGGEKP